MAGVNDAVTTLQLPRPRRPRDKGKKVRGANTPIRCLFADLFVPFPGDPLINFSRDRFASRLLDNFNEPRRFVRTWRKRVSIDLPVASLIRWIIAKIYTRSFAHRQATSYPLKNDRPVQSRGILGIEVRRRSASRCSNFDGECHSRKVGSGSSRFVRTRRRITRNRDIDENFRRASPTMFTSTPVC